MPPRPKSKKNTTGKAPDLGIDHFDSAQESGQSDTEQSAPTTPRTGTLPPLPDIFNGGVDDSVRPPTPTKQRYRGETIGSISSNVFQEGSSKPESTTIHPLSSAGAVRLTVPVTPARKMRNEQHAASSFQRVLYTLP
ncbi:hypothetical protein CVT24_006648 [Panaeolus cyanescens]|uniref:Uncharacterized protein n=1 Tax=Panaeolus cyanescens TaxID=181874 RepID=A0A409YSD9_9AGAR|nr:hypothetical protein CVT24_006648 [Panaeolus cyanescens]